MWLRDRESTLSSDEIAALAKKGDLTSVGETLAAETRKPLTGLISGADTVSLHNPHAVAATRRLASAGNIVRALLIQLQASARDAQVALAAVDDLLAAQTVTIRALALVPALLLLVLLTKGVRILFLALFSRSVKRTDDVKSEAAATLQEMQRIALLARDDSEPLSDVALGALAGMVHGRVHDRRRLVDRRASGYRPRSGGAARAPRGHACHNKNGLEVSVRWLFR